MTSKNSHMMSTLATTHYFSSEQTFTIHCFILHSTAKKTRWTNIQHDKNSLYSSHWKKLHRALGSLFNPIGKRQQKKNRPLFFPSFWTITHTPPFPSPWCRTHGRWCPEHSGTTFSTWLRFPPNKQSILSVPSFSFFLRFAPHISQYSFSAGLWKVHRTHSHTPPSNSTFSSSLLFFTTTVLVSLRWKKLWIFCCRPTRCLSPLHGFFADNTTSRSIV